MDIIRNKKRVLIIGGGEGGINLLGLFHNEPNYDVIGVVDKNMNAAIRENASKLEIPFSTDYNTLILNFNPSIIINVTGDQRLQVELESNVSKMVDVIGGDSARLVWDLISAKRQNEILQSQLEIGDKSADEFIVGSNSSMIEISQLIKKVAPTPTSVLIRGETGTGKEVVARAIHRNSRLINKPFVIINCTALTPSLVESELFGHKKGAFTGAGSDKIGLLEKADDGTVFLDEIGDMELEVQAKLLRFLQTGEIRRVGAVKSKIVNVRVIAATNRDIESAIQKGEFRGDLFYRFNTFTITIPPLKQRVEDIELFANYFLKEAVAKVNIQVDSISSDAITVLQTYSWPGNLRELKNVIERSVVLSSGSEISAEALPLQVTTNPQISSGSKSLIENRNAIADEYEKKLLIYYLKNNNGNVVASAKDAKISRRTFHRLLEKYSIAPKNMRQ